MEGALREGSVSGLCVSERQGHSEFTENTERSRQWFHSPPGTPYAASVEVRRWAVISLGKTVEFKWVLCCVCLCVCAVCVSECTMPPQCYICRPSAVGLWSEFSRKEEVVRLVTSISTLHWLTPSRANHSLALGIEKPDWANQSFPIIPGEM